MRRTANTDLAAFHKIDARGAGLDANVTAATQDGFHLAVDDFDIHRSGDADGFAVDDSHEIGRRFIGARSGCGDKGSAQDGRASRRNPSTARARLRIGEGRHSEILPGTVAESLAYTIRRLFRRRMKE